MDDHDQCLPSARWWKVSAIRHFSLRVRALRRSEQTGDRHEISVLTELKMGTPELVEIPKDDFADAHTQTLSAISAKVPTIFQAALDAGQFAGFADFLILDGSGRLPGLGRQAGAGS
jgi:hypothetical protein